MNEDKQKDTKWLKDVNTILKEKETIPTLIQLDSLEASEMF